MKREELNFINERTADIEEVINFAMKQSARGNLGLFNLNMIQEMYDMRHCLNYADSDLVKAYYYISSDGIIAHSLDNITFSNPDVKWTELCIGPLTNVLREIEFPGDNNKKLYKVVDYLFTKKASQTITIAIPDDASVSRFEYIAKERLDDYGWDNDYEYCEHSELDSSEIVMDELTAEQVRKDYSIANYNEFDEEENANE